MGSQDGVSGTEENEGARTAREDEDRVREPHGGEEAQVLQVDRMAADAEQREPNGEAVHGHEEALQRDHAVDQPREQLLRRDGVLFHQFREVVQPGSWRGGGVSGLSIVCFACGCGNGG